MLCGLDNIMPSPLSDLHGRSLIKGLRFSVQEASRGRNTLYWLRPYTCVYGLLGEVIFSREMHVRPIHRG